MSHTSDAVTTLEGARGLTLTPTIQRHQIGLWSTLSFIFYFEVSHESIHGFTSNNVFDFFGRDHAEPTSEVVWIAVLKAMSVDVDESRCK